MDVKRGDVKAHQHSPENTQSQIEGWALKQWLTENTRSLGSGHSGDGPP